MAEKSNRTIIRGDSAANLEHHSFESFEERPVNYHVDVLAEFGSKNVQGEREQVSDADLRKAINHKTSEIERKYEERLKTQMKNATEKIKTEIEAEFQRATELLTSYADLLKSEKEELASRYEQEVLDLAFDIAGKILGERLTERPESISDITRHAIQQVIDCNRITVRANPSDLDYLQGLRADLASQLSQETRLEIISDKSIELGGSIIDTEKGSLDARISSQIETMKSNLSTQSRD